MTICQRCAVLHEFIPKGFVGADRVRCDACADYALLAERERCARLAANSKCMCQEDGSRPDGCYDAVCSLEWVAKKIRAGS